MARNSKDYKKALNTQAFTGDSLLGDFRKPNNFIVQIDGIVGVEGNSLDAIIQTAFLPQVSVSPIEIRHGNDSIKLAGVASWSGGQITILDVLSKIELDALIAWFETVYDPSTGEIGLSKDYKKKGKIIEVGANGNYVREWTVEGMWPSDLDLGTLDAAANGDAKQISMTIQIDPMKSLRPKYNY